MKEKINTMLERLDVESRNGLGVSEKDITTIKTLVKFLEGKGELTETEINEYNSRISTLNETINNVVTLSGDKVANTAKSLTMSKLIKDKLATSEILRKRVMGRVVAVAAAAIAIGNLVGCSLETVDDSAEVYAQVQEVKDEPEKDETEEKTEMDEKYQEIAEKAYAFAQDEVNKGLPANSQITEENKEIMIKTIVEYYMLNQMDSLTDVEWANIFQNSTTNASDLMNAKFSWEWIDEQRVTVGQDSLDYSLLFEGQDAVLLNTSAEKLKAITSNEGEARTAAIADFINYVRAIIDSENVRMQYSERALDTFRAIYFDALLEVENGTMTKEDKDELQHAVNTTITCSMIGEDALDVEDPTIHSLQSKYETYMMEKLTIRFQNGWDYVAQNRADINEYNDISYIVKYVSDKIDLSKQYVLPDYEAAQAAVLLVNDGKSADDSNVRASDGSIISLSDLQAHGIDPKSPTARQQYEQAEQAQEEAKSEASATLVKPDGTKQPATNANTQNDQNSYIEGFNDAQHNLPMKQNHDSSYENGYTQGKKRLDDLKNNLQNGRNTTFESVTNGEETTTETVTTDDYTDDYIERINPSPAPVEVKQPVVEQQPVEEQQPVVESTPVEVPKTPGTTFVPIDSNEEIIEESEITEYSYQNEPVMETTNVDTTFVPVDEEIIEESEITEYTYSASSEIAKLEALKEALISNIDEQLETSLTR